MILSFYFFLEGSAPERRQSLRGSQNQITAGHRRLCRPHGQGFVAATKGIAAGKTVVSRIRLRRTLPSSRGWRSRSSTGRGNSAIIEKHNAAVGKADLSSFGGMASSKERNPRAAVEWRAKGSLMEQLRATDVATKSYEWSH